MPKTISVSVTPGTRERVSTSRWTTAAACWRAASAAASCCERHQSAPPTTAMATAADATTISSMGERGGGGGCDFGIMISSGPAADSPASFFAPFDSSSDTISSSRSLLQDSQIVRFSVVTLRSTWNSPSRRRMARRTASRPVTWPKRASTISPFSMNTTTSCSGPAGDTIVTAAVCRLML